MNTNTIDTEKATTSEPCTPQPKTKRAAAKKVKAAKKADPAKKTAAKPKADRANKKAEVIAMMKRANGATLAETMATTEWQAHTVRGFVSILGSKGGPKINPSKNAAGEWTYKIGNSFRQQKVRGAWTPGEAWHSGETKTEDPD